MLISERDCSRRFTSNGVASLARSLRSCLIKLLLSSNTNSTTEKAKKSTSKSVKTPLEAPRKNAKAKLTKQAKTQLRKTNHLSKKAVRIQNRQPFLCVYKNCYSKNSSTFRGVITLNSGFWYALRKESGHLAAALFGFHLNSKAFILPSSSSR